MASDTPEGDKTKVDMEKKSKKGKRGKKSKTEAGSNSTSVSNTLTSTCSNTLEHDSELSYDSEFDSEANFELLQKHYIQKILSLKAEFQAEIDSLKNIVRNKDTAFEAKLETLHKILENKDDVIGNLNKDIGELKQSVNFLTNETTVLKRSIDDNVEVIRSRVDLTEDRVSAIKEKTVDLEDRSRRCNLVFFNFPEVSRFATENCEETVENFLLSEKILENDDIWIDRAHRLGRRRPDHDTRPRPIIVKFSYYKQKERILKNGAKLKHSNINVSEDYSKETLHIHNQLRKHGKEAKEHMSGDPIKSIKQYKVTYRRLSITYFINKSDPVQRTFTRSFLLDDIIGRSNWFVPPQHHPANPGS